MKNIQETWLKGVLVQVLLSMQTTPQLYGIVRGRAQIRILFLYHIDVELRIETDMLEALRYKLISFGITVDGLDEVFYDIKSMITNKACQHPYSTRGTMLFFISGLEQIKKKVT